MTEAARFSLVELFFSGGVVLSVLLWQLWSVRRDQRRHGDGKPNGKDGR
jgi:hypothetical protein